MMSSRFSLAASDPTGYGALQTQLEDFARRRATLTEEDRQIESELAAARWSGDDRGPSEGARALLNGFAPPASRIPILRNRQVAIRANLAALAEAAEIARQELIARRIPASRPILLAPRDA